MTIYVDTAMIQASVPNGPRTHTSYWCHLMSDQLDPEELHLFAESIGMKRAWFQHSRSSVHDHYDVNLAKRRLAVRAGAVVMTQDGLIELLSRRRELYRVQKDNS
jgi:hypothetical protein